MEQYIPKSEVVAEIDRRLLEDYNTDEEMDEVAQAVLASLKFYIGNLETKEVDLVKEYNNFIIDTALTGLVNRNVGIVIAKHFFGLGLKAQKGE